MSDTNETMETAAAAIDPAELEKLQKLAAERDQYLDMAQRARAEFENYQKRSQKDRELERRYAYTPLIFDLLPVFDNLERTLQAAQQAGEKGALVQGVAMVQAQFLGQLKRHGITRIEAQGNPFDPHHHPAVMQQPSAAREANTVSQA